MSCRTPSSSFEEVCVYLVMIVTVCNTRPHRDRENSTVFVADIPNNVTEEELTNVFKDVRIPVNE